MHSRPFALIRLLACLLVLAALAVVVPASAQETLGEARDQREAAKREQYEAQLNLNLLEAADEEVVAALEAANALVAAQQAKVDSARQAIDVANSQIRQGQADLDSVESELVRLAADLQVYAVDAYLNAAPRPEDVWLTADDLTEGLRRVALIEAVGQDAADVLSELRVARETHEASLVDIESATDAVEELRAQLDVELASFEEARVRQAEIKAELDARAAKWESQLAEFEAEERRLTEFIREEEERLARLSGGGTPDLSAVSTQGFVWPTPGKAGSRGFGPRMHPILGYVRMHSGIDITGGMGAPIWSAKAGTVIAAGWRGGYGNAVVVQHGGGVSTLYAHMSRIDVSVGQEVATGQQIGAVGSTGLSTGPHLHFETRVNGTPQNPRIFLP